MRKIVCSRKIKINGQQFVLQKDKKKKNEISAMLSIFNGNVLFSFSSEVEPFTAHTQEYILRIVDARKGTKKIQQMLFSLSPPPFNMDAFYKLTWILLSSLNHLPSMWLLFPKAPYICSSWIWKSLYKCEIAFSNDLLSLLKSMQKCKTNLEINHFSCGF